MKKLLCLILVMLLSLSITSCRKVNNEKIPDDDEPEFQLSEMNGVWIASVYNLNYPSKTDLTKDELKKEVDDIINTVTDLGLNTIFFQVRAESDALYNSDIFPVSKYLSSNGKLTLDVLEYAVEVAHKNNIQIHAWVNPLRVTSNGTDKEGTIAEKYPELCVQYGNRLYLDCGNPKTRTLVCNGIKEIVENYNIDGIVFDDYFYPYPEYDSGEFDDNSTFEKYASEGDTLADWRRENVNQLIKSVYDTIKQYDKLLAFGVSPFGIWKNGNGDETGSLTTGLESYNAIYCDTVAWVKGGYVDYISPQLYWNDSFETLSKWWQSVVNDTEVKLVISHAAYRYDNDWDDPEGLITEQVDIAKNLTSYCGSMFYGYKAIESNVNGINQEIKKIYVK